MKKGNGKYLAVFVAFVVLIVGLVLGYEKKIRHSPVKIGLAINLSGAGANRGLAIKSGIVVAVRQINASGGINGHPLELVVADDKNTQKGVYEADRKLLDQGCPVIIGHGSSSNTLLAYPVVTGRNRLLITGCTATTRLSGKDDLFFRTCVDNFVFARTFSKIFEKEGIRSVSILADKSNQSFTSDLVQQLERTFRGHLHVTSMNSKNEVDWEKNVDDMLRSNPKAILLLVNPRNTAICLQKLRAGNFKGPIYATPWSMGKALFAYSASAIEGLKIVSMLPTLCDNKRFKQLDNQMGRLFHCEATMCSARAYELAMIVADAMKRCGERVSDPLCIKEKLLSGTYNFLADQIHFDRFGDMHRPLYVMEIKGKKPVVKERII